MYVFRRLIQINSVNRNIWQNTSNMGFPARKPIKHFLAEMFAANI